jgi:hypothetical protein
MTALCDPQPNENNCRHWVSFLRWTALAVICAISGLGCALRGTPSQDYVTVERRAPPEQPSSGPGGSEYPHGGVTHIAKYEGVEGYGLFLPAEPAPPEADVVVFLHGLAQVNPKMYGAWIEHLVRKGNILIYPRYEVPLTPSAEFERNAVAGIKNALAELQAGCDSGGCVKPRLNRFAVIGHSYGAALSANITVNAEKHGLPKVAALMVNQGWYGSDIGLAEGYGAMPSETKLLAVIGATDVIVGPHFGKRLFREALKGSPFKNLVKHRPDKYNLFAAINAGHDEPLSLNEAFDNGLVTPLIVIAFPLTRENAVDYFCYWKLSEALLNCAFEGRNCEVAFGDTPAQRFMGKWGDGRPLRELEVTVR